MIHKLIRRIRIYKWFKRIGIRHPWKMSGDKKATQYCV